MQKRYILVGLALALTACAFAASAFYDAPSPTKLEGVIHDFSPQSTAPTGPYVVSGPWSLQFQPSGSASFSAALTMVRSDLNVAAFGGPDSQAARNFHTHHIDVTDGSVTTVNNVLIATGNARITSNGNEVFPGSSVRVEVSGGNTVAPSNMKLTILGPAAAHFTTEPYEGVVLAH